MDDSWWYMILSNLVHLMCWLFQGKFRGLSQAELRMIATQTFSNHAEEIAASSSASKSGTKTRQRTSLLRPNLTIFDMILNIIVALENRHLKRSPLRSVEQQKVVTASWPKKDEERRKKRKRESGDGAAAVMEVKVRCA